MTIATDNEKAMERAFEGKSDAELESILNTSVVRSEALAEALSHLKEALLPHDSDDLVSAVDAIETALADTKASRDLLGAERSRRKRIAINDAMAHPERYPERVVHFRRGYTPPGWKSLTKVRLVDYDRGRGYAEVLRDGEWYLVGDLVAVSDLEGKYI